MKKVHPAIDIMVLASLLLAVGANSLCFAGGSLRMECCKSGRPCPDSGVKAADCCASAPPVTTQVPPATLVPPSAQDLREVSSVPAIFSFVVPEDPEAGALPGPDLAAGPPGMGSTPLFLLNAALLR